MCVCKLVKWEFDWCWLCSLWYNYLVHLRNYKEDAFAVSFLHVSGGRWAEQATSRTRVELFFVAVAWMMHFRFVLCHFCCLKMCSCLTSLCRVLQRCHEHCLTVTGICSSDGCEEQSISCMVLTLKPVLCEILMTIVAWREIPLLDYFFWRKGWDRIRRSLTCVSWVMSPAGQDEQRKWHFGQFMSKLPDNFLITWFLLWLTSF